MASNGIRDRVAVIGMGCTRFGEHWGKSIDDLLIDAVGECVASVEGFERSTVDAYWLGTMGSGTSGLTLSRPLKIDNKPVTRVENYCATGSEAFRNAAYAVACGAYDCVMAVGGEKLKDSGFSGLVVPPPTTDGTASDPSAPAVFSLLAPAYANKYGVDRADLKRALARIASKNHANGAHNPRAQYRREMDVDAICAMPAVAGQQSVMDCAGVADGSAAAIVCRAEDAHRYTDRPLYVKALSMVAGNGSGLMDPEYDYTTLSECQWAADDAYAQAGISDPRSQLAMAEVHDCFTPTELVLMEDLGFSARGEAHRDVMDGVFDLDGELPVNPDGGLKSFGHPIGASGLRMLFECWAQFRGEAGERQLEDPKLGLTHNLGGSPGACVSFVSIVGAEPDA
jgi:acetyl-CoA C-acetyltransferase